MRKKLMVSLFTAAALVSGAVQAGSVVLGKVAQRGEFVLGVRDSSAPLSYSVGGGKYVGYHVEICEALVKKLKKRYPAIANAKVKYAPVTSQNRIPLVQNGTVDLECGSTTNNTARGKQVNFADTTFFTQVRLAVKKGSGITDIQDLNGRTVATTTGSTSIKLLRKKRAKDDGLDFKEVYGRDHADSFLLLETGRADAFVIDDNILAGLIASSKNPSGFEIVGTTLSVEPIAIMMNKSDPELKKVVDFYLGKMMRSGEVTAIYNKWFVEPIPPKNVAVGLPMSNLLKQSLKKPVDHPAEYYNK